MACVAPSFVLCPSLLLQWTEADVAVSFVVALLVLSSMEALFMFRVGVSGLTDRPQHIAY